MNCVENIVSEYPSTPFVLCGDLNISDVNWLCDNIGLIGSSTLSPATSVVSDSLSFLNFFQLNNILNHLSRLLDLNFLCSNDISVNKAPFPLVDINLYNPTLAMSYPLLCKHKDKVDFSYRDFKTANCTAITEFLNS